MVVLKYSGQIVADIFFDFFPPRATDPSACGVVIWDGTFDTQVDEVVVSPARDVSASQLLAFTLAIYSRSRSCNARIAKKSFPGPDS